MLIQATHASHTPAISNCTQNAEMPAPSNQESTLASAAEPASGSTFPSILSWPFRKLWELIQSLFCCRSKPEENGLTCKVNPPIEKPLHQEAETVSSLLDQLEQKEGAKQGENKLSFSRREQKPEELKTVRATDPQRRLYSSIDNDKTFAIVDIIRDESLPIQKRKEACEIVAKSPGSYNPFVLLAVGQYFLKNKEFDKAAVLCVAAIHRSIIDMRISGDNTLGSVPSIASQSIGEVAEEFLNENELKKWQDSYTKASENFEIWDRNTPRAYDDCWIRPHSLKAFEKIDFKIIDQDKKKEIIESYYKGLRVEIDFNNVSKSDKYFFDVQNRIFSFKDSNVSFLVPINAEPALDNFGKLVSLFLFKNKATLWLNNGWSKYPKSLEEDYKYALSAKKPDETIERVKIGKDHISGYRCRSLLQNEVENSYCFYVGNYSFDFDLTCKLENEKELLQEVQKLLNSIEKK